jgi:hypothetical protein
MADVGMAPSAVAADVGLTLAATWTECVTAATTLWRADLERRRFLLDSAVAASASSAAALQWLVSPAPTPLSGTGRHVGESDIDAIQQVVRSYRELDNRLGGGRVRGAVVHHLNSDVTPLLTDGRYARRSLNMDGRFVRGKAFNLSLLATALAEQDDIEQACAVSQQALSVTSGLRSARSIRYIKDLQSALRPWADAAVVRTFNAQVAERLPAASARIAPR